MTLAYPGAGYAQDYRPGQASSPPRAGVILSMHGGAGFVAGFGPEAPRGFALHAGTRMMLAASIEQRFGVDVTYTDLDTLNATQGESSFISGGLVLEQLLFGGVHMALGTMGYANVATGKVPFGLLMEAGWEPIWDGKPGPRIVYRAEVIFAGSLSIASSLSFGWSGLF